MVKNERAIKMSKRFLKRDLLKLSIKNTSANVYMASFQTLEEKYGSNPLVKLYTDGVDDMITFISDKYGSKGERFKTLLITIMKIPKYKNLLNDVDKQKLKESNIQDIKQNKRITYDKTRVYKNKIDWNDFINKVNSYKITHDSKLNAYDILLLKLYIFRTIRDDYGALNLIDDNDDIIDYKNYYNVKTYEITLNDYKTSQFNGRICFQLPDDIVTFIKKYKLDDIKNGYLILNRRKEPYSNFVLTSRISQILTTLYEIVGNPKPRKTLSLNTLRQSKITQLMDRMYHTYEDRENLAIEMLSSISLQENTYKRVSN